METSEEFGSARRLICARVQDRQPAVAAGRMYLSRDSRIWRRASAVLPHVAVLTSC